MTYFMAFLTKAHPHSGQVKSAPLMYVKLRFVNILCLSSEHQIHWHSYDSHFCLHLLFIIHVRNQGNDIRWRNINLVAREINVVADD